MNIHFHITCEQPEIFHLEKFQHLSYLPYFGGKLYLVKLSPVLRHNIKHKQELK